MNSPSHSSISTATIGGANSNNAASSSEDFHISGDLDSIQERKDEAMQVLKSDLMAALDKEVKSLDSDNWKFEGPRSRIHLISRRVVFYFSICNTIDGNGCLEGDFHDDSSILQWRFQ